MNIIIVIATIFSMGYVLFLAFPQPHVLKKKLIPAITEVTVKDSADGSLKSIKLPYTKPNAVKGQLLDFKFSLTFKSGQYTSFRVMPDDCVEIFTINNVNVAPGGKFPPGNCDWNNGFLIDLEPFLQEGKNDFHITVRNHEGPSGLRLRPTLE